MIRANFGAWCNDGTPSKARNPPSPVAPPDGITTGQSRSDLRWAAPRGSGQVRTGLSAGGRWIRIFSTAARKPRISGAPGIAGSLAPGEGDVAKPRRSRLRHVSQNGTAPLVKVPAPSGPAAFPLRDAPVARFCRRTSRRSIGTRTAATATRAASEAAPAPSALG